MKCVENHGGKLHSQQRAASGAPSEIEDFSKDCPGTRYGASLARNDCDVCVSGLIWHLFVDFGKPTIDHCCVPRFFNGRRTSPSLSYHSFPLSSELRKHFLVALCRDEGTINRRGVSLRKHCSMQWATPPKDFHFLSRAQEYVDSPIIDHGKARKGSRFLKADAVPSVLFFFFCKIAPASLRAAVSNGMSVGRSRERHGLEKKRAVDSRWPNDETTLYRKLAERERLQRNRSKVREGSADRAADTR